MKRFKQVVIVLLCVFLLSGCMKERIKMDINKDKSMNLEFEMLLSDSLMENAEESENANYEQEVESLKKRGFDVKEKKESGYSGYVFTKKYSNIDKLSNNKGEEVNIGNIIDEEFDESKIFSVKKGFLKNTYTAKFVLEADTSQDMGDEQSFELDDEEVPTTNEGQPVLDNSNLEVPTVEAVEPEDGEGDLDELNELMSHAGEMEITYTVHLPYAASNNNANKVSNDRKELIWNINPTSQTAASIEYTFSMYNITNLIIIAAIVFALIVIIIVVISISKKKNKGKETLIHTDYDSSIVGQINETKLPEDNIPQGNANHEFAVPEEPQVNVTSNDTPATPTMMGPSNQNTINTESSEVVPTSSVSEGPSPVISDEIQLDIPDMVPLSEMNKSESNQ